LPFETCRDIARRLDELIKEGEFTWEDGNSESAQLLQALVEERKQKAVKITLYA
jgi:hypothetical protein